LAETFGKRADEHRLQDLFHLGEVPVEILPVVLCTV
jgi:hypothetical protein